MEGSLAGIKRRVLSFTPEDWTARSSECSSVGGSWEWTSQASPHPAQAQGKQSAGSLPITKVTQMALLKEKPSSGSLRGHQSSGVTWPGCLRLSLTPQLPGLLQPLVQTDSFLCCVSSRGFTCLSRVLRMCELVLVFRSQPQLTLPRSFF